MSDRTEKIIEHGKRFLTVAVVTILIWLLAESESVRVEKVPVDLSFLPEPNATRMVTIGAKGESIVSVTVTLQGPAAGVDELAGKIRSKLIQIAPGVDGVPVDPGRRAIDLREVIRGLPVVRETRVAVAGVDPPIVQAEVDNLILRDAKVKVVAPDGQLIEGSPEPIPARVRLRVPESINKLLPQDLELNAPLDAGVLANLSEGRRITVNNVPVEVPEVLRGVPGVRMEPSAISVAIVVRTRVATTVLATVPVHVRIAPTEIGRWDIQIPVESRQLTDVTITGPSEEIDLIKAEERRPIAYIPLSFEELENAAASGQPIVREPIFTEFPSRLRFDSKQKMVQIMVKRRDVPPATGAAPPLAPPGGD